MSRDSSEKPLRSRAWFGRQDKMGFYYRSFLKNDGTPQDQFDGKPVVGICNSWSELTPCNQHFRDLMAYGTMVLHVASEATARGSLPLVRTGDQITLDVPARSLHLHVDEAELARRREAWVPPVPRDNH